LLGGYGKDGVVVRNTIIPDFDLLRSHNFRPYDCLGTHVRLANALSIGFGTIPRFTLKPSFGAQSWVESEELTSRLDLSGSAESIVLGGFISV
jgi:hypothetical protein